MGGWGEGVIFEPGGNIIYSYAWGLAKKMNNQEEWIGFGDYWIVINKLCNIQERRDIDLERKQKRVLSFILDLELV